MVGDHFLVFTSSIEAILSSNKPPEAFTYLTDRHSALPCVIFVRRNELPVSLVFENIFRPFLYQEAFKNLVVYDKRNVNFPLSV